MKLEYGVTRERTQHIGAKYSKVIRDFLESGEDLARIHLDEGDKIATVYQSMHVNIMRHKQPVTVSRRQNCLYLIRK